MKSNENKFAIIRINDLFDDINDENIRLRNELLFANKCINILYKYKYYLEIICTNFGNNLDSKLFQELTQLDTEYNHVLSEKPEKDYDVIDNNELCSRANRKHNENEKRVKYEFRCDWIGCNFVTNRNSRLRAHRNYHTGVRPFECAHCDKAFVGREALSTHVKAVHTTRAVKCDILKCMRRTKRIRSVRVWADEKPFKCDHMECTYASRTRQALREHKLTHSERTIVCTFIGCAKVFKNKKQLKNHLLTHSIDPPHKCGFVGCEAAFRTYKTLKIHRLKHTNETPKFSCDWPGCDFCSVYNWILQRHRMIHTGEKPYKCSWPSCESRFRRNHYLKAHMLKHSGEKPFACDWPGCDKRFQSKQALRIHIEKTHNCSQLDSKPISLL